MTIRLCKECGFILGTKPHLKEVDGVCLACINESNKKNINFSERQEWLSRYIRENKTHSKYDCVIAVSGGKDSMFIVKRLRDHHGVKTPLLVTVSDEFTSTKAGATNRRNVCEHFGVDHIVFRCNPDDFRFHTKTDFEQELHPLKWFERRLYEIPIEIARDMGIKLCFFGENSDYEYGSSTELNIFHPMSCDTVNVIYFGAIWPYHIHDSLEVARECGFIDLDFHNEWQRSGTIDRFTQIDSIGYMAHIWCKFIKFGFQRTSDIACRYVRDGILTREQAIQLIRENDWRLDMAVKHDFCRTIDISESRFDEIVDKFANKELLYKDINGNWKRLDF